jgi:hypothetical protein
MKLPRRSAVELILDHYFIYDRERDQYFCNRRQYHEAFLPRLMEVIYGETNSKEQAAAQDNPRTLP